MSGLKGCLAQLSGVEVHALLDVLSMHVENVEADTPAMTPGEAAEFEACKAMLADVERHVVA